MIAESRIWKSIAFGDVGILLLLGAARIIPLFLTNGELGWHRDELDVLDNARYLDWGYVSYPPFAPFVARVALTLFGPSLLGVRFFSTLAMALAIVLAGLIARELGGGRLAQVTAAVATAISPIALLGGALFGYSPLDVVWWVLLAYLMVRLLKSNNPRWWLAIGAVIGIGMMTKYTIAFLVAGIIAGVLLTHARRFLFSPWLWAGAALAFLIILPNLIWQIQHDFITRDFLTFIHARDIRIGRTEGFLVEQFVFSANMVTIPIWVAGLFFYLFSRQGKTFRALAWMFIVPFGLFYVTQGRSYYLAADYPMLLAAGAVLVEQGFRRLPRVGARLAQGLMWTVFAASGIAFAAIALPIAPIHSPLWDTASDINGELEEMVGWPELVEKVAGIYASLPAEEKPTTVIFTGNYGEAGAINLLGRPYGLPRAISGVNTYWLRGYGDPPPQTVITLGIDGGTAYRLFETCNYAGPVANKYSVFNEEMRGPGIYLCRTPRAPWSELWTRLLSFG